MLWCEKCGVAVTEPVIVQETLIHSEMSEQDVEYFKIPYCPSCFSELDRADRCACGEWKNEYDDWCAECLEVRNETVQSCINEIRVQRKMELNTDQIRDLMMTYFD